MKRLRSARSSEGVPQRETLQLFPKSISTHHITLRRRRLKQERQEHSTQNECDESEASFDKALGRTERSAPIQKPKRKRKRQNPTKAGAQRFSVSS